MRMFPLSVLFAIVLGVLLISPLQAQTVTPPVSEQCAALLASDRPIASGADASSIRIIAPRTGDIIYGTEVAITVETRNFDLALGSGHWHLWVNGTVRGMLYQASGVIELRPGTYQLCATDQNNCVKCENYICDPINTTPPTITVTLKIELKNGNQAVTCKGKCDGRITVEVTSSDPRLPYRYRWSHDSLLNSATASNLCPGISYRVTVTDAAGNSKVSNATVLPDAAAITLTTKRIKCASTSTATDGSYEALVSGAVLPVSYTWCNNSFGQVANDLAGGDCSVQIVDANGCTASENFTVCIGTSPNADCFKGRLAISPNSDGLNDFLDIACAVNFENTLTIFDRWGNQVFAANNYNGTWAGTDEEGNELTEGTYMWILQVRESGADDRYFKGTVTIVR